MFHTIYVLSILIIIPIICTLVEYKRSNKKELLIYFIAKWFVFWAIGFRATTAALMQILNPSYTAALLQVGEESKVVIQELGCAQLGIGILGMMSLLKNEFRKSACLSYGIFMVLVSILHITRLSAMNFVEFISLLGDVFIIIVACLGFLESKKYNK